MDGIETASLKQNVRHHTATVILRSELVALVSKITTILDEQAVRHDNNVAKGSSVTIIDHSKSDLSVVVVVIQSNKIAS